MLNQQQFNLGYDSDSFAGPLDLRRVRQQERNRTVDFPWMLYDPSYVKHLEAFHGGSLTNGCFLTRQGNCYRLGRFVNFATEKTLSPPFQPCGDDPRSDRRLNWSIGSLETGANIAEGTGAFLVPFGILFFGEHHPDEMDPIHCDFVCFDYSDMRAARPKVVVWPNGNELDEMNRCEAAGLDPFLDMDTSKFTEHVAENFDEFLTCLGPPDETIKTKDLRPERLDEPGLFHWEWELGQRIEKKLMKLDLEFVEHLRRVQFEDPHKQSLRLDDGREIAIKGFLHFDKGRRENPDHILGVWNKFRERFGDHMIPFAEILPVGNYLSMEHRTEAWPRIVICWTQGQNPPIEPVAEKFDEFLARVHDSPKSQ